MTGWCDCYNSAGLELNRDKAVDTNLLMVVCPSLLGSKACFYQTSPRSALGIKTSLFISPCCLPCSSSACFGLLPLKSCQPNAGWWERLQNSLNKQFRIHLPEANKDVCKNPNSQGGVRCSKKHIPRPESRQRFYSGCLVWVTGSQPHQGNADSPTGYHSEASPSCLATNSGPKQGDKWWKDVRNNCLPCIK